MLTKNMAWGIYGASNRFLFHVKASFEHPPIVGAYVPQ